MNKKWYSKDINKVQSMCVLYFMSRDVHKSRIVERKKKSMNSCNKKLLECFSGEINMSQQSMMKMQ